jgi:replicative superfamily II helicase
MSDYLSILLKNPIVKQQILHSKEEYIWKQLKVNSLFTNDKEKLLPLIAMLINEVAKQEKDIENDIEKVKLLHELYDLLLSIDIIKIDEKETFEKYLGIDEIETSLLYYFYLAVFALKSNQIIRIRLDLIDFKPAISENITKNWQLRVLNKTIIAFILLVRKKDGFAINSDINQALQIIQSLYAEQQEFEKEYLKNQPENSQEITKNAYLLGAFYHLSKAVVETVNFLLEGYAYKGNLIVNIDRHLNQTEQILHSYQEHKLVQITQLLRNSLKELHKNSIWNNTKFGSNIQKLCEFKSKTQNQLIDLLPSQQEALQRQIMDTASSVVILQMPTSAGKTLLAEFNMLQTKALKSDAKVIYIVPSRALVNQVYYDLKADFEVFDLSIEKATAAIEIDPNEDELLSERIDILVTTPEKLNLLIRKGHSSVQDVALFVIDEAHFINNENRGIEFELLLTILKREQPDAKFMLLSPFIGEASEQLKKWLQSDKTAIAPIKIDWQPAKKLIFGLNVAQSKVEFHLFKSPFSQTNDTGIKNIPNTIASKTLGKKSSKKDKITEYAAKYFLETNKAMLFICDNRGDANKKAEFLYNTLPQNTTQNDEILLVKKFVEDEIGNSDFILSKTLSKSVAIHHAGLSEETRILIEYLIRNNQISYVCSTTTVAEGVNFPVSTIFFDTLTKGRQRAVSSTDFWNIAGRAGRTLVDNYGKIIFPLHTNEQEDKVKDLIQETANQISSLLLDTINLSNNDLEKNEGYASLKQYILHLLRIAQNNETLDVNEIENLFKDSFAYHLANDEQKKRFVDICKITYKNLTNTPSYKLYLADNTGFSITSISVIEFYAKENNIKELDMTELFSGKSTILPLIIKNITLLKETKFEFKSQNPPPLLPKEIAAMLCAWVNGENLANIAEKHTYFKNIGNRTEKISELVSIMSKLRHSMSWGFAAWESVLNANKRENKIITNSFTSSYLFFGVNNENALLLRKIGLPRALAMSMSEKMKKDNKTYTYKEMYKYLKDLVTSSDLKVWNDLIPNNSELSGEEWKKIVSILVR